MKKIILAAALTSLLLGGCDTASDMTSKVRGGKKSATAASTETPAVEASQAKAVKPLGYLLDVNDATDQQLSRVSGMTPEIRKLIENTRPFLDMAEFDDELSLLNLSNKARKTLYADLFMVIDVNNSPVEDFQFVPGMSKNLSHKLENARPYKDVSALKAVIKNSRQGEDVDVLISYFKITKPKK